MLTGLHLVSDPILETASYSEVVPNALDGERIDRVVSFIADVSRSNAAQLVSAGMVHVDGRQARKGSSKVTADSLVEVLVPVKATELAADAEVKVPIVYEDDQVLVVNKPIGLVVHPGAGVSTATMVNGLLAAYPELRKVGEATRPGIVHRLDKNTSGLLAVARTPEAYTSLVDQLKARTVTRRYLALAFGVFDSRSGTIEAPLGRSLRDPTRQALVMGGRAAVTHYEVKETLPWPKTQQDSNQLGRPAEVTVLSCRLETGRTHQIRVHLNSIGHPIVGDDKYGGSTHLLGRPFLHAMELGFAHPVTHEQLFFEVPLPSDLEQLLGDLSVLEEATDH